MLCVLSLSVIAQDVQLSNDPAEHNLNGVTTQSYTLTTPVGRVTFQAKHTARATSIDPLGTLTVQQKVNNKWETIYEGNPGIVTTGSNTLPVVGTITYEANVAYENFSVPVNYRATELKFVGNVLNNKQIQNVCTYMASFVEVTPANLNFGEIEVFSEPVTKSFYVEHCNVTRLSMSSSNADFALNATTVTNSGIAQYKTDTFTVTFTPNIRGQHAATIVVTNGTQTDSIHCSAKVTKKNPVLTWNVPETITVGDVVDDPVTSTCLNDFALISCSENVQIVCGEIRALAEGPATIEVMQLGDDDYWNNKTEEFSIQIQPAVTTAVESRSTENDAERYVRNGQVYIRAAETEYAVDGRRN